MRRTAMADQSCDLHDAAEHFFDQVRWNECVARAGDKRTALERISRKDPAGISYYRQMAAERPGPEGAKARAEGELIDLGKSLVTQFIAQLADEVIIAT